MKLADLERHLRQQGCVLYREGGAHTIWLNPQRRKIASIPRHREIKDRAVRSICKQLEFHNPKARLLACSHLCCRLSAPFSSTARTAGRPFSLRSKYVHGVFASWVKTTSQFSGRAAS
jgi:mRNA interferase HicA